MTSNLTLAAGIIAAAVILALAAMAVGYCLAKKGIL